MRELAMRLICISLLAVLGILYLSSVATSLTIPSDNNKPAVSEEVRQLFRSGIDQAQEMPDKGGTPSGGGGGGGEGDKKHPTIISAGDMIQIKKEIFPPSDGGYLVGDFAGIFVEVRCTQNLDKIRIKEFVDNEITIINTSQYAYRLVTPDEISDYSSRCNGEYFENFDYYCKKEYKRNEGKIHQGDRIDTLILNGLNCVYNYKCDQCHQDNLTNFLRDDLGISWAENADTSIGKNNLKIYNKSNRSSNITINFNNKKTQGVLNYKNNVYHFFIKCDNMHCAIERPIEMNNGTCTMPNLSYEERIFDLSVYDLQNDFDIEIVNPRINERYAYWYFVKFKNPGNFKSTTTVLTSYDGGVRNVPDIESSLPIKIKNPSPDVNIRLNKLHLLKEEKFDIVYEIRYPIRPNSARKVNINFPQLNDYYSFVNKTDNAEFENDKSIPIRLDDTNSANISKTIKYKDSGEYYLPGITINGECFPFQKEKLIVDTRFERYAQFVTLLSGIIAFFFKDFIFPQEKKKNKIRVLNGGKGQAGGKNDQFIFFGIDLGIFRKLNNMLSGAIRSILESIRIPIIIGLLLGSVIIVYWFYTDRPFFIKHFLILP